MAPELFILRHGQTEWNLEGRFQGRLDSPLTATGIVQAERQRAILAGLDLDGAAAFSSPQGRAMHTAGIAVAPVLPMVRTDDRLCEIGVGDWSGRLRAEVSDKTAADEMSAEDAFLYDRAPGGEGLAALRERCLSLLGDLGGPTVVVTHGITSRMLRCVALGLGDDALPEMPGGQGVVHHVSDGRQRRLT